MKITKNQLRKIIREEKARLMKEAPAGQYDQRLADMFKEAVVETVYEVAVEQGLVDRASMDLTAEALQAAAAALSDAAREFDRGMESVKIGKPTSQKHITGRRTI